WGLAELFQEVMANHTVADHDQGLFTHLAVLSLGSQSGCCVAIGFAESDGVPVAGDIGAGTNQFAVPGPVGGIAQQDGAGQPVAIQQQLAVDRVGSVLPFNNFGMLAGDYPATGKNGQIADFQSGGDFSGLKCSGSRHLAKKLCQDSGLLVTGFDQAKGVLLKLTALTQCVDMRVGRHQVRIDSNTPVTVEAGVSCQSLVGFNTGGNNYQVRGHYRSVTQFHGADLIPTEQGDRRGAGSDTQTPLL